MLSNRNLFSHSDITSRRVCNALNLYYLAVSVSPSVLNIVGGDM